MPKRWVVAVSLLVLLAFAIPIEHKYDKLFRFYSLTLLPKGLEISKSYDQKIYFYPSDLIALFLFSMGMAQGRIFLKRIGSSPLWIVLLSALASIGASPFSTYPLPYIRLLQLFTPMALFLFLSSAFSSEEKKKAIPWILRAIVAAGTFQALIGIAQYFHQAPIGLRILGEVRDSAIFTIYDGSRWLIDQLLHHQAPSEIVRRASGTLPHANVFGGFLLFSLFATYALWIETKRKDWFFFSVIFLQFFALSLSYSRSALFGWGIGTSLWFFLMLYQYGKENRRLRQIGGAVLFSFFFASVLLYNQYFYRGGVVSSSHLAKDSDEIRKFHQKTGLKIIADHPIFGVGFTQLSERIGTYCPKDSPSSVRDSVPHNIFLFLACETGLFSLAAYLFFIISLYRSWAAKELSPPTITFASLFTGFLFIGCCDFYPIFFQQGKLMFFLTSALLSMSCDKGVYTETAPICYIHGEK